MHPQRPLWLSSRKWVCWRCNPSQVFPCRHKVPHSRFPKGWKSCRCIWYLMGKQANMSILKYQVWQTNPQILSKYIDNSIITVTYIREKCHNPVKHWCFKLTLLPISYNSLQFIKRHGTAVVKDPTNIACGESCCITWVLFVLCKHVCFSFGRSAICPTSYSNTCQELQEND